jgi:hypothetical protein
LIRRVALAVLCLVLFPAVSAHAHPGPQSPQQPTDAQLQALAGEYTDPNEPGLPISFYPQNGKLIFEYDRFVPTELTPISATEFDVSDTRVKLTFSLDAAGRGVSVVFSSDPGTTLRCAGQEAFSNNPVAIFRRTGEPVPHIFHDYQRSEAMIRMRDGVKLHAVILKPSDITTPLPFLLMRTPYGVGETNRASFFCGRPELARSGYIYVAEDIRGRFKSESMKAPTPTTPCHGCLRTSLEATVAPALSAPAIPAFWR